jgi:hypothetical protein
VFRWCKLEDANRRLPRVEDLLDEQDRG